MTGRLQRLGFYGLMALAPSTRCVTNLSLAAETSMREFVLEGGMVATPPRARPEHPGELFGKSQDNAPLLTSRDVRVVHAAGNPTSGNLDLLVPADGARDPHRTKRPAGTRNRNVESPESTIWEDMSHGAMVGGAIGTPVGAFIGGLAGASGGGVVLPVIGAVPGWAVGATSGAGTGGGIGASMGAGVGAIVHGVRYVFHSTKAPADHP